MDSITQFVLGAAVGQLVVGKKIGRKAALYGGLLATLPDIDGVFFLKSTLEGQLLGHRGFSHSLMFSFLASFTFSFLLSKISKKVKSYFHWFVFLFFVFFTHSLIDAFTTWGTQLFWPHSLRVAWNAIFIIDPFYTLPLLIGVIITAINKKLRPVILGITISSMYLCSGLVFKEVVNNRFENYFKQKGIIVQRYMTRPTPFNNFVWGISAETKDRVFFGYCSIFKKTPFIVESELKNHELLADFKKRKSIKGLSLFLNNYYLVKPGDPLVVIDARYGRFGSWKDENKGDYIFKYEYDSKKDSLTRMKSKRDIDLGQLFKDIWSLI